MGKLRILCVHGYRQSEKIFREKSGGFRKLFKRYIDFVFLSAPHEIPEEINLARPEEDRERGWWFSKPDRSYHALDKTDISTGYEDSVALVKSTIASDGPFDGILGFSQGASFVSLLCTLQKELHFKFAILIAGFKSMLSAHSEMYSAPIECPSFHVIGSTDGVIPSHCSEELMESFTSPQVYRHEGGHYIPSSPLLRTALLEFLAPFNSQ